MKENKEDKKARKKIEKKLYKNKARDRKITILKSVIVILLLMLLLLFLLLKVIYENGAFTVNLNEEFSKKTGLVMFENLNERSERKILKTETLEYLDNISETWLPDNLHNEKDGSHNGNNYMAYTFYLQNQGADSLNYWYSTIIDDVIKNVDEAIRVRIYLNDTQTTYAKASAKTGTAEPGTVAFRAIDCIQSNERKEMKPGEIDKITIVVWIEGNDPECLDNLLGGGMKMHVDITEEDILQQ